MAASAAIAALPPPQQIAKGLAGVVSAELSKSPVLGILGVIMGAGLLGLHVEHGNWITDGTVRHLTLGLGSKSAGLEAAMGRAVGVMGGRLRLEAYTLAFIDGFHLLAWSCVAALLLIALLRRSPLDYGDLSIFQQQRSQHGEARS